MTNDQLEMEGKKQGFSFLSWDPLEILDERGYLHVRLAALRVLDRIAMNYTYEQTMTKFDKELEDVRAFHNKFGFLDSGRFPSMVTKRKLRERAECLQEELDEFKKAIESQDFAEQADALIDLVYFAKGTAVIMGLPWEDLWDDVQRANFSKERGITKRGHAFDVIKPEGWQKPQGEAILKKHGFNPFKYQVDGVVNESLCVDDVIDSGVQAKIGITEYKFELVEDLQIEMGSGVEEAITAALIADVNKTRND